MEWQKPHMIGKYCATALSNLLLQSLVSSFPVLLLSLRDVAFQSPSLLILTLTAIRKFMQFLDFKINGLLS